MSKKKKFRFKNYIMNVEASDDMSYAEYDIVPNDKEETTMTIEEAMKDKTPGIIVKIDPDEIPGAAHKCAFCGKCHPRYVKMDVPFECRSIEVLWALGYKVVANPVEAWKI